MTSSEPPSPEIRANPYALYHLPTRQRMIIARRAMRENQPTLHCPRGTTTKAATSGPIAVPELPPTWKTDWARPCCPPEAIRATLDDSGWKTEDPSPTRAAGERRSTKLFGTERRRRPVRVNPTARTRE